MSSDANASALLSTHFEFFTQSVIVQRLGQSSDQGQPSLDMGMWPKPSPSYSLSQLYNRFNSISEPSGMETTTVSVNEETLDSTKRAQTKRKDLAAQKRAKIIARMTALQKNFIEQNIQLCSDAQDRAVPTSDGEPTSSSPTGTFSQLSSMISSSSEQPLSTSPHTSLSFEPMPIETTIQSCLGTHDFDTAPSSRQELTCIFCQESSEVKLNSEAIVISAYVQK